jgi:predicted nuclease of restriction endonuclease-like (RecB) superfamily
MPEEDRLWEGPAGYADWLADLKDRIRQARLRANLAVNHELVLLYWQVGTEILERQNRRGWGARVIDRLAADLRREFPGVAGWSARNLKYMRAFAAAWPDRDFVQGVLAQLPWWHQIALLEKVGDDGIRRWYAQAAIQHGWSRNVLVHQIESRLHLRQGQAATNFRRTLPTAQSDLAEQIFKDPYHFDFLGLGDAARERDLERSLLEHLRKFLIELGMGFAFVGSQHPLEVGGQPFYLDLLFYHLDLRRFIVIDLKMGDFIPEHAGKMSFYLAAVDDLLRRDYMAPSIGLILCKARNGLVVEYALRDIASPIGVAHYRLAEALPPDLADRLPTPEQILAEFRPGERPSGQALDPVENPGEENSDGGAAAPEHP